jgi:hypothetical protein
MAASSKREVIDFRIGVSMFEMSDVNAPWRATFRFGTPNQRRIWEERWNADTSASGRTRAIEMSNDIKGQRQRFNNASVKRHLDKVVQGSQRQ